MIAQNKTPPVAEAGGADDNGHPGQAAHRSGSTESVSSEACQTLVLTLARARRVIVCETALADVNAAIATLKTALPDPARVGDALEIIAELAPEDVRADLREVRALLHDMQAMRRRNNDPAAIRQAVREEIAEADRLARIQRAQAIWGQSALLTAESLAGRYLVARAISPPWPPSLRQQPRCLVAAVTPADAPQAVRATQRTYLEEPGRKAVVGIPRITDGPMEGCGVVLGEVTDALVVAEGVETALSASRLLHLPAVATLGAANMRKLRVPRSVARVVIAADPDPAGEAAARELGERLADDGRAVEIAHPPADHDFNDIARVLGGVQCGSS
jgi:hypothetical protein